MTSQEDFNPQWNHINSNGHKKQYLTDRTLIGSEYMKKAVEENRRVRHAVLAANPELYKCGMQEGIIRGFC